MRKRGIVVKCNKSSRRGREYLQRIVLFYDEIKGLVQTFRSQLDVIREMGPGLCQDMRMTLTMMLGHSKMKFHWVFKPPFTVWQCDSAGAARKFLTTVRKQILDKDPKLDRVSAFFTLTSPPCIGADMEKLAAGRGCSPILRTQLTAYQLLDMPSCTSEHILRPSL